MNMDTEKVLVDRFERYLRTERGVKNGSPTLRCYRDSLNKLSIATNKPLIEVNKDDITALLEDLYSNYKPKSIARHVSTIRHFYKWLQAEGLISELPVKSTLKIKLNGSIPAVLTEQEINGLRAAVGGSKTRFKIRDKAIIELLLGSACRIKELLNLTIEDIDFSERAIKVQNGKGDEPRYALFNKKAKDALEKYLTIRTNGTSKLFQISDVGVRKLLRKYAKKANINKRVYPHLLRHSSLTMLANRGVPIFDIQAQAGHKDPSTTSVYVHLALQSRRERYDQSNL